MNWQWRMYDPREGENYSIKLGESRTFPTLKEHFFCINVTLNWKDPDTKSPRDEINILRNCMCTPFMKNGNKVFFSTNFETHITKRAEIDMFNEAESCNGSRIGYYDMNAGKIKKVEKLREELQSYEDWVIGSCTTPFSSQDPNTENTSYNLDTLLKEPDKIGSLYYINGETFQQIFLMRIWDGFDEWLEPIFRSKTASV
jgi:hypothetical protein